ncbi:MAG: ATP-binding protein [Candidatus Omnitrophota bacterium]
MKEIEALVNNVAHEVKNPLAIILQGIDYLKEKLKSEDENVGLILKYMVDAINRADNVIAGLLEFASLSKFDMQSQDLNAVMEKTLSLMQVEFDRYRIRVDRKLAIDLPLLKIDKKRMEQAFVNILLNAVQAMPEGGPLCVETGLKARPENKRAVFIEIKDTGVGIPKESLDRIFGPFFTTKRERGSSGMGLAMASQIIRTHGGGIAIENRVGSPGVRVTLTLPV